MTRSDALSGYDEDFYAWTQAQAAALRKIPRQAVDVSVDIEHLAEEIEDLGKRDLREVRSFLTHLVEHLIKITSCPGSINIQHWRSEVQNFHFSAAEAYSPSMRQLVDMSRVWRGGTRLAEVFLSDQGVPLLDNTRCPFSLDDLISDDFHVDAALSVLAERLRDQTPYTGRGIGPW